MFNISLKQGHYPSQWKDAYVVPIYKGGNKLVVDNYRPITVLNAFARIFESIVAEHLGFNLKQQIHVNQHGFMEGRSTATNLCHTTDLIQGSILKRNQCDIIYFDLSKAFDSINHHILLYKLRTIGLSPRYANWFESYLDSRKFRVKLNGVVSSPAIIRNGIPQGSPLGPLLFNIYVNDLCTTIQYATPILYADDLKLIGRVNNYDENVKMQNDIENVQKWCKVNQMKINTKKTILVTYNRKTNYYVSNYTILGNVITKVQSTKDLGVIFDTQLRFTVHVNAIINESKRLIGYIFNQWYELPSTDSFILLFKVLVRPKLEYAAIIWGGLSKISQKSIEGVQICFIRILCFKFRLPYFKYSYNYWCSQFRLEPLYLRRQNLDRLFIDQLINNKIKCTYVLEKIMFRVPKHNMRTYSFLITKDHYEGILHRMVTNYNKGYLCKGTTPL
jgi:retron-type reverse transcriptase